MTEPPDNVRRLHPPVHSLETNVHPIGAYPGGPVVSVYGASAFDHPAAWQNARRLMHETWGTVGCAVVGADSADLRSGTVAVATHPSIAEAIADAHNASLKVVH